MATVSWTSTNLKTHGDNVVVVSWTPLTNTNQDGQAFEMPGSADRSVQVLGTFGAAGSINFEGSNEATPTTWAILNDPSSAALTFTAAKIEAVLEMTRWVRPKITAGDGTTSLTVLMAVKKP